MNSSFGSFLSLLLVYSALLLLPSEAFASHDKHSSRSRHNRHTQTKQQQRRVLGANKGDNKGGNSVAGASPQRGGGSAASAIRTHMVVSSTHLSQKAAATTTISSSMVGTSGGARRGSFLSKTRVRYSNSDEGSVFVLPTTTTTSTTRPKQANAALRLLFPTSSSSSSSSNANKECKESTLPRISSLSAKAPATTTATSSTPPTPDTAVFVTYLCSSLVMNLPILLVPMAAAEYHGASEKAISTLVVSITSIAIMGGGLGKFVNGFVCQELGAKRSSCLYLVGAAFAILAFSFMSASATSSSLGYAYAAIEFFVSMQWTALSLVLAQFYNNNNKTGGGNNNNNNAPGGFGRGIAKMSLASTCGQLLSKSASAALLQYLHWRQVARLGALVALFGAMQAHFGMTNSAGKRPNNHPQVVKEKDKSTSTSSTTVVWQPQRQEQTQQPQQSWATARLARSIQTSAQNVMGNRLFWAVGYAHAMSMVAKSSDRILGEFFAHATSLPRSICGGLTLSVTAGLVHGLMSARGFAQLKDVSLQRSFIVRRYMGAVLSALALAVMAHSSIAGRLQKLLLLLLPPSLSGASPHVMAAMLTVLSAAMTSCMAFQFFQLPSMVSQHESFGRDKAVCMSWFDATAFFLSAPIWAGVGRIVSACGWSPAFVMLAALFGVGGMVMCRAIAPVLSEMQQRETRQPQRQLASTR